MVMEEDAGVADWLVTVYRSVTKDSLIFFLVIRVHFTNSV